MMMTTENPRLSGSHPSAVFRGCTKRSYPMKNHKFWAWATMFCMMMVFITGYKHK